MTALGHPGLMHCENVNVAYRLLAKLM